MEERRGDRSGGGGAVGRGERTGGGEVVDKKRRRGEGTELGEGERLINIKGGERGKNKRRERPSVKTRGGEREKNRRRSG